MKFEEMLAYCLEKTGACEDRPFGEYPVCCKVGGRIFAQLYPDGSVTVKCGPQQGEADRAQYPGAVTRAGGQWAYWNTLRAEQLPEEAVRAMLDRAYGQVFQGLTRRTREEISNPSPEQPPTGGRKRRRGKK